MLKSIKMIRSYNGHAQFLAEAEPSGWFLSNAQVKDIPSPYRHSPAHAVLSWRGKQVVWFETAHRKFEVFEVPADFPVFPNEHLAIHHYINSLSKPKEVAR